MVNFFCCVRYCGHQALLCHAGLEKYRTHKNYMHRLRIMSNFKGKNLRYMLRCIHETALSLLSSLLGGGGQIIRGHGLKLAEFAHLNFMRALFF